MTGRHVVHFSVATLFAVVFASAIVGGSLLIGTAAIISVQGDTTRELIVSIPDGLPNGEVGVMGEEILKSGLDPTSKEAVEKYGPLNKQALAETKEGRILDAIRSRRSGQCSTAYARCQPQLGCQAQRSRSTQQYSSGVYCQTGVTRYPRSGSVVQSSPSCPVCPTTPATNPRPVPALVPVTPQIKYPVGSQVSPYSPAFPFLPDTTCPDGKCPLRILTK